MTEIPPIAPLKCRWGEGGIWGVSGCLDWECVWIGGQVGMWSGVESGSLSMTTSASNLKLHTNSSYNPDTPLVSTSVNSPKYHPRLNGT